jgi:hypothetical protein
MYVEYGRLEDTARYVESHYGLYEACRDFQVVPVGPTLDYEYYFRTLYQM